MKYFLLIQIILFSYFANGQETFERYDYHEYILKITDSTAIIFNSKLGKTKVLFTDHSADYYIDEFGKEISSSDLQSIKISNPEEYSQIKDADDHYKSFSNSELLSAVGPYISYTNEYYAEGGAHPTYGTNYITYNLETDKKVNLTEMFGEKNLIEALVKNNFVKKYLQSDNILSLDQLYEEFMNGAGCDYRLDLSAFSFGAIKAGSVSIHIGISYDCEVSRGNFEVISIEMEIPSELTKALNKSNQLNLLDKRVGK